MYWKKLSRTGLKFNLATFETLFKKTVPINKRKFILGFKPLNHYQNEKNIFGNTFLYNDWATFLCPIIKRGTKNYPVIQGQMAMDGR
jgi:hypothetical protein